MEYSYIETRREALEDGYSIRFRWVGESDVVVIANDLFAEILKGLPEIRVVDEKKMVICFGNIYLSYHAHIDDGWVFKRNNG